MAKESMTPRERWLAVLGRQAPDRMPMDYWGTQEATEKVMRHLGCATKWEMFERLHIDKVVGVAPEYVGPKLPRMVDMYGRRYKYVDYGTGRYKECVAGPLAEYKSVAEIDANYTWPSVDWFDFSVIPAQLRGKKKDYPVQGGGSEPFLIYADLRGRELAYMDLVERPEIVHYCLGKMFDLAYEYSTRIYEQIPGRVTYSYVAEDLGGQDNLLYSPKAIREFFLPQMKRMIDLAHQAGAYAFFHSDGAIRKILPDMIAIGIDVLNPIQWRSPGMDRAELKAEYGDKVVLHGGVDNQYTLPFGTADEVCREVIENITIMGMGGGYILAPCHNIQAVSPAENIVAMYRTGYEHAWN